MSGALDAWPADEIGAPAGAVILRSEQLGTPVHWTGIGTSVLLATLIQSALASSPGGALWVVATVVLIGSDAGDGLCAQGDSPNGFSIRDGVRHMRDTFGDGIRLVRRGAHIADVVRGTDCSSVHSSMASFASTNSTSSPILRFPKSYCHGSARWTRACGSPLIVTASIRVLYLAGIAWLRRKVDLTGADATRGTQRAVRDVRRSWSGRHRLRAPRPIFGWPSAVLCLTSSIYTMTEPLLRTWLNQHVTSDVRATVLSMNMQVNRLGMMGGGLAIGALGNVAGLRVALSASALFLVAPVGIAPARVAHAICTNSWT